MTDMLSEWQKFAVGTLSTKAGWTEPSCRRLITLSHVAHVSTALEIVKAGQIRPRLVYDKSKLNKDRILVVWLSPNYWGRGFRYGNISFEFDWKTLIANKKYYWVEAINYGVKACRILVTEKDHSDKQEKLIPYDPTLRDGPWWYDTETDTHYWNGEHCLEIMLESELSLQSCISTSFVDHHSQFCSISHATCPDKGKENKQAGAEFIAGLVDFKFDLACVKLTDGQDDSGNVLASTMLKNAWTVLKQDLLDIDCKFTPKAEGGIDSRDISAPTYARALLHAYSTSRPSDQKVFASRFESSDRMINACVLLLRETLGINYLHKEDDTEDDFL